MRSIAVFIIFIIIAGIIPCDAGEINFRGPLAVRNQFPATLPFLAFTAGQAYHHSPGNWHIAMQYSHANTYTRSAGILSQLPQSDYRMQFDPAQLQTDPAPGQYYIDSGSGRMALQVAYTISRDLSVSLELPLISYYGGFLDIPIENFHKLAGYPFRSRTMMSANQTQFFISANNKVHLNEGQLGAPGIGDVVLQARQLLISETNHFPAMTMRIAAKLPTGDVNTLKGSGSFDFGADVLLSKKIGNGFATTNLGVVIPGKWKLIPEMKTRPSLSWILVYEQPLGSSVSLLIQNQILTSVLSHEFNADIAKTSYEWTLGSKIDISKSMRISIGVTENYINHENAPDFGMHAGLEWQL